MNTSELVKQLCKEQKITIAELARRIGQSRQNLYKKLKRETLSIDEIKQIADALGVTIREFYDSEIFDKLEPDE